MGIQRLHWLQAMEELQVICVHEDQYYPQSGLIKYFMYNNIAAVFIIIKSMLLFLTNNEIKHKSAYKHVGS